jgi:hypothetical protein
VQSSLASQDQGFTNHSLISRRISRHRDIYDKDTKENMQEGIQIQAMFEKQQQERQWLATNMTKQHRKEGQEVAEFEEQLQRWSHGFLLCRVQKRGVT